MGNAHAEMAIATSPRDALARIIEERMVAPYKLAERSGIPRPVLYGLLNGRVAITPHYAALLAAALNEPVTIFLEERS